MLCFFGIPLTLFHRFSMTLGLGFHSFFFGLAAIHINIALQLVAMVAMVLLCSLPGVNLKIAFAFS